MTERGPLTGKILNDKYQIEEQLGVGGFGTVYKAMNIRLNRLQAIKVINDKHLSNAQFQQRFEKEAQMLAKLNHSNILHVDDYGIENGRSYLVMPFVNGGTLSTIIPPSGFSLEKTNTYLRQICDALDFAHTNNVVHLDLKPDNILHQNGTLFLSDFGLARLMEEDAIKGGRSLGFGTPVYAPPEQIKSYNPQRTSDIYALGVILFRMLTGRLPFEGSNVTTIVLKQLREVPPSVHAIRSDVPLSVDDVIRHAMAIEPMNRYSSAGELFNDFMFKARLSSEPIAPPRITPTRPVQPSPVSTSLPPQPQITPTRPVQPSTDPTSLPPQPQREKTLQIPGSLFLTPYAQVLLDTPPPLDVMNRLLQEVGKQVQQRKQGGNEKI